MAISLFGTSSLPTTDTGTNTGPQCTIAPPASMVAGDVALVFLSNRLTGVTFANIVTGGQTWNAVANSFIDDTATT